MFYFNNCKTCGNPLADSRHFCSDDHHNVYYDYNGSYAHKHDGAIAYLLADDTHHINPDETVYAVITMPRPKMLVGPVLYELGCAVTSNEDDIPDLVEFAHARITIDDDRMFIDSGDFGFSIPVPYGDSERLEAGRLIRALITNPSYCHDVFAAYDDDPNIETELDEVGKAYGKLEDQATAHYNRETGKIVLRLAVPGTDIRQIMVMTPAELSTQDEIRIAITEYGDDALCDEIDELKQLA